MEQHTTKRRSLRRIISEMVGIVNKQPTLIKKLSASFDYLFTSPTVNWDQTNYYLSRALYYCSEIEADGDTYGSDYLLAAGFCKPIINSTIAFTLPDRVRIETADEYTKKEVNKWLSDNFKKFFDTIKHSLRDADSYILVEQDGTPIELDANNVDKIVDPMDGNKTIGYDVKNIVLNEEDDTTTVFVTEYRENEKQVFQVKDDERILQEEYNEKYDALPIIHYCNEKEPNKIYGYSEFQNLYYLLTTYHKTLSQGLKAFWYNSEPSPFVENIEDLSAFEATNSEYNERTGRNEIKWEQGKILLGTGGAKFGMLSVPDTSTSAEKYLNILFLQILQASETPEFVFGGAVASSKASVSEQVPIMTKKAQRKQEQYRHALLETVKVYLLRMNKVDKKFKVVNDLEIIMPEVVDKNLQLNIEIVKTLRAEGLITDETALELLNIGKIVPDLKKEAEQASEQVGSKYAAYATGNETNTTTTTPKEELKAVKAAEEPPEDINQD